MKNKKKNEGYEQLYICMQNVAEKRKGILLGIKNSLVMQQEHEQVMEMRKNKDIIKKEIKISLDHINKLYKELRKNLPNVKNILSYTEKEINELERQINTLKIDTEANIDNMKVERQVKNKLKRSNKNLRKITEEKKKEIAEEKKYSDACKLIPVPKTNSRKLSKLDRIQNNLKVIESKLKHI